jgi:hypothetical protein
MAVQLSPDCRDDNHGKCPGYGWDLDADRADVCPCTCHPETVKCGLPHEATGLAYLGPCLMGANHDGPHQFTGPIAGSLISVTIDGPEDDAGVDSILEDIRRALAPGTEPPC